MAAFDLGAVVAHIKADLSDFNAGMSEAKQEMSGFGSTVADVGGAINSFAKQASVVSAIAAGAIAIVGKNALDSAQMFQEARLAFNTMLGDEKKAADLMSQLSAEAQKSAFTLPQVIQGSKQLLAYGFGVDKIVGSLDMLGNVAYGVKAPLEDVVYVYGTLRAQGRAYTRDIIQFAQRGIPIWDELAKVMKVPVNQVQALVEQGKVGFPEVEQAFKNMTAEGAKFHNAMSQPTLALTISNISDAFTRMGAALMGVTVQGEVIKGGLFERISAAAGGLLTMITANQDAIIQFGKNISDAIGTIITFLTPFGQWVLANKDLVLTFLAGVAAGIAAILVVAPLIVVAMNPFLLVFTALALAAGALYTAWQTNFFGIRDITLAVVDQLSGFFTNVLVPVISYIASFIMDRWSFIAQGTLGTWQLIKGIIEVAWALIYGILSVGIALLQGDWQKAWENLKNAAAIGWDGVKNIFSGIVNFIAGWGGTIFNGLVKPFQDAWHTIQDLMNKIKDAADLTKRHSPSVIDIIERGVDLANKAFDNLSLPITATQHATIATSPVTGGGQTIAHINIDMGNSIISDQAGALRMGEIVGDQIIKKLQSSIRF
jgi:hypothetical protein